MTRDKKEIPPTTQQQEKKQDASTPSDNMPQLLIQKLIRSQDEEQIFTLSEKVPSVDPNETKKRNT